MLTLLCLPSSIHPVPASAYSHPSLRHLKFPLRSKAHQTPPTIQLLSNHCSHPFQSFPHYTHHLFPLISLSLFLLITISFLSSPLSLISPSSSLLPPSPNNPSVLPSS